MNVSISTVEISAQFDNNRAMVSVHFGEKRDKYNERASVTVFVELNDKTVKEVHAEAIERAYAFLDEVKDKKEATSLE